jgi:hypothetical protein
MVPPRLGQWFLLAVQGSGQVHTGRERCDRWGASELSVEGQSHQQVTGQLRQIDQLGLGMAQGL